MLVPIAAAVANELDPKNQKKKMTKNKEKQGNFQLFHRLQVTGFWHWNHGASFTLSKKIIRINYKN